MTTKKEQFERIVERQDVLGEVFIGGTYNAVRLTRVKYKENPNTLIDIRMFQRGYDEEGEEVYYPTKKGVQFLESKFQKLVGKWSILPTACLHPRILERAFPRLLDDDCEGAVFQAFKAVEVAVRKAARLDASDVGTSLMRKAFDATRGPLTDMALPAAERESCAHLFAGAIGSYKNPCSHRDVDMNFIHGFESLMLASHLLKIVDRRAKELAS